MLDPGNRELLLDALRPPDGFRLDYAVGTSFTLDLEALMLAPLAFALFDTETAADGADSAALLASIRNHGERISLFCQAGMIAIPRRYSRLAALLEGSVHGARVPRGRLFHPKVWVLRYTSRDGAPAYRLLCLTRNLAFDRSWDTVLRLEGTPAKRAVPASRPVAAFLSALPKLAVRPIGSRHSEEIARLALDLRKVAFAPPQPFTDVAFHPLGISRNGVDLFGGRVDRLLVVSPFLGGPRLARLGREGRGDILVSRPESLDELGSAALAPFDHRFVLSPPADGVDSQSPEVGLTGLHAKLFVADCGWDARVFTGSANATDAAFSGNVEFLVELHGKKSCCGVDALLAGDGKALALRDLLQGYDPRTEEPGGVDEETEAVRRLESAARELAAAGFSVRVAEGADEHRFDLTVSTVLGPAGVVVRCWPITLGEGAATDMSAEDGSLLARFPGASLPAVTSFIAVELRLGASRTRFVVNADMTGAPPDRIERLVAAALETKAMVVRYLLLMLASGTSDAAALLSALDRTATDPGADASGDTVPGVPLLEVMLKALSREPARLDAVARVIDDLRASEEGRAHLPDGFEEVWTALRATRRFAA